MESPVVLITGALTGIGRATAIAFAKEGARLIVAGRHDDAGQQLAAELRSLGADSEFIDADVRRDDDVRALIDGAVTRFGRLDVAVNCAGTEGTPGPITEQTAETYAATFDTNVLGTLLSMKHELRVMEAQDSGSIINILVDLRASRRPGCLDLRSEQACGRGTDQVRRARGSRLRCAGQCRGPWPDGHGHARSIYRYG